MKKRSKNPARRRQQAVSPKFTGQQKVTLPKQRKFVEQCPAYYMRTECFRAIVITVWFSLIVVLL
jgi:hypothetical protein